MENIEENGINELVEASLLKRFINYLVDYFCIAILISIILVNLDSRGYGIMEDIQSFRIRLIGVLMYALFYVAIEGGTKGKSFGKWLTKTRVVEYDGATPDMETFIVRSFSRIIPFEPFSFFLFSQGWHDKFSKTLVIDETLTKINVNEQ
jgi:uncharacterized RDD family membrane protein YckC